VEATMDMIGAHIEVISIDEVLVGTIAATVRKSDQAPGQGSGACLHKNHVCFMSLVTDIKGDKTVLLVIGFVVVMLEDER
jgi:hypothetical protein